ncbi:MAG TPA: hypothetical protein VGK48_01995 [Terriglobia bacterium]|jgi:hypothetical protein
MRIKKKEAVIPFRETVAFRLLIAGGWAVLFIVALYILAGAFRTSLVLAIVSGLVAVGSAYGIVYNLDHMRDAKVPKETMNRMKRR